MNDLFFIAGAQRSGTTYLCHLLNEHPEIELAAPLSPEPIITSLATQAYSVQA